MTTFTCEALTKRFGHFTAVDHVSFAVAKGSIFGFLNNTDVTLTVTPANNWSFLGWTGDSSATQCQFHVASP